MRTFAGKTKLILAWIFAMVAVAAWGPTFAVAAPAFYLKGVPEIVHPGDVFQVVIVASGISGLAGVDVTLSYHPNVLEVIDSDPNAEGVNILPMTTNMGLIKNEALDDGEGGTTIPIGEIRYFAMGREPIEGGSDVDIAKINFRVRGMGGSPLTFRKTYIPGDQCKALQKENGMWKDVEPALLGRYLKSVPQGTTENLPPVISIGAPTQARIAKNSIYPDKRLTTMVYSVSELAVANLWIGRLSASENVEKVKTLSNRRNISAQDAGRPIQIEWDGTNDASGAVESGRYSKA